ncbi:EF-hand domain pair domain-containing protein [Ditylenchus destructor]|uniref:EF-hand domain pair domain-containing protein n=1 Tax=Ditylenchus destructor TaxID=166010 RepID=A0AAD4MUB1_9BILA|nr:EF-hand domain pair domain-containing protein [Ditylenchus destructor]
MYASTLVVIIASLTVSAMCADKTEDSFKTTDANGDGKVSFEELKAIFIRTAAITGDSIEHGESAARLQFDKTDADKDGYLTLEEIRQTIADEAFYRQILLFRRSEL